MTAQQYLFRYKPSNTCGVSPAKVENLLEQGSFTLVKQFSNGLFATAKNIYALVA
jgi:hypothetical protein